jgi:hypothetical protein
MYILVPELSRRRSAHPALVLPRAMSLATLVSITIGALSLIRGLSVGTIAAAGRHRVLAAIRIISDDRARPRSAVAAMRPILFSNRIDKGIL